MIQALGAGSTGRKPVAAGNTAGQATPRAGRATIRFDGHDTETVFRYMNELSRMPLLSRSDEARLGRQVAVARRHWYRAAVASDYVLSAVVSMLREIESGSRRLDRTLEVAAADAAGKRRLTQMVRLHRATLAQLLAGNRVDFRRVSSQGSRGDERRELWRRIQRRRQKGMRLVEELGVRSAVLRPSIDRLTCMAYRMESLAAELRSRSGTSAATVSLRRELRTLIEATGEGSRTLKWRMARVQAGQAEHQSAQQALCNGNLRLVVSIAKRYANRGVPFLDRARGEYRPHARCRQIRLSPRLQVLDVCDLVDPSGDHTSDCRQQSFGPRAGELLSAARQFDAAAIRLMQQLGRRPQNEELAEHLKMSLQEVQRLSSLAIAPQSLDEPKGHDDCNLAEVLQDQRFPDQVSTVTHDALRRRLQTAMRMLTQREREVLRLRYGLNDGHSRSLAELGAVFAVSRERVRQIEQGALAKLRTSRHASPLASFVD